ncbi:MAG: 50S ribosomal protein L11 [Candidatus Marsarchaeota archaeon]|jgi:large subunit ribosomal protein L11|nr:50S ribosomal protein L11 [Candidatus Marsarchaeota archaeon]MCL5419225.1 50S ribosomal protein L11 [Candidatus Marsarchaeota archaeon]
MGEVVINGLIEGGKATGGPPFGPALGPLGVNINAIITEINKKTEQFAGIKMPVKVVVDTTTKQFKVEIGAPPTSALILKELGAQSGAKGKDETIGNLTIDQVKKIATSKEASLYGKSLAEKVKQVLGTCKSMGVKVENEDPKAVIAKVNSGEIKV